MSLSQELFRDVPYMDEIDPEWLAPVRNFETQREAIAESKRRLGQHELTLADVVAGKTGLGYDDIPQQ